MARTTKTPSYAPVVSELKATKKTTPTTKRRGRPPKNTEDVSEEKPVAKKEATPNKKIANKKVATKKPEVKKEPAARSVEHTSRVAPKPEIVSSKDLQLPFYERYLLTVDEASAYFHIGSKKMYEVVHKHEDAKWLLRSGNRKMVKRALFAKWLDEQSEI